MGNRHGFTEAQVRKMIKAARAEDPRAVIELVTDVGVVRIMPEAEAAPATPFDAWKAKRDAGQTQGR